MNDEGGSATELRAVVRRVYERHSERDRVSPLWLATEAMVAIDFPRALHPLGYLAAHLEMRAIAREFCRANFDPTRDDPGAGDDLFSGTLQPRYPRPSPGEGAEPEYVLRDAMTGADYLFNVRRMRKAAMALQEHARALEAEMHMKFPEAA